MNSTRQINFRQVRSFGEVISDTFEFFRENARTLMVAIFYYGGPPILLLSVFTGLFLLKYQNAIGKLGKGAGGGIDSLSEITSSLFSWEMIMTIFLSLGSTILLTTTVYSYVKIYVTTSEPITKESVWEMIKEKWLMVLGSTLAFGLLLMLIILFGMLLIGVTVGIGALFILPAMVYLMVALSLFLHVQFMEETSFSVAVRRSFELVKGNFWSTFGVVMILFLIYAVASSVFGLPLQILSFLTTLNTVQGATEEPGAVVKLLQILASILANVGSYAAYPLINIGLFFQYFSIVESRENVGMLSQLEKFGRQEEDHFSGQ